MQLTILCEKKLNAIIICWQCLSGKAGHCRNEWDGEGREYHVREILVATYCYGAPDLGGSRRQSCGDQFWTVRSRLVVRKRLHFTYRWRDARGISIICSFRVLNSPIRNRLSNNLTNCINHIFLICHLFNSESLWLINLSWSYEI